MQAAEHQPLMIRTISHLIDRRSIARMVVDEAPFLADGNLRMGIVIFSAELHHDSISAYRYKDLLIDGTLTDLQAGMHGWNGGVDNDGSTATIGEAHRSIHYVRADQVSFDERSYKPPILKAENFWLVRNSSIN